MELKNRILRELGTLARTVHAIVEPSYKDYGLQKGQFIYVARICENIGINQMQLSNLLKVDKTSTAKVVQKLIKNAFVTKIQDEKDKRSFKLYPTQKSFEVYDVIIQEENKSIDICFEGFTKEEMETVYRLSKRMRENTEKKWYQTKNYKE